MKLTTKWQCNQSCEYMKFGIKEIIYTAMYIAVYMTPTKNSVQVETHEKYKLKTKNKLLIELN